MAHSMNEVVVIPVLNPTGRLVSLVHELQQLGFTRFIIVDDGSSAQTQFVFDVLEARDIAVLHHPTNLGKGSAIKTALARMSALYPDAPAYVTVDGDGQHVPQDVLRVCMAAWSNRTGLTLGTRNIAAPNVPLRSRVGNLFSRAFFRLDTGMNCPDTQTGLRCVPTSLVPFAIRAKGSRYDYEMNMLTAAAKEGVPLSYVSITTVYADNNAGSHFATVRDSLLIYRQFLCFALCSILCAMADLGMFAFVTLTLDLQTSTLVALGTLVARIGSGTLNFALNRTVSFDARREHAGVQAIRYGLLFVAQMLLSMLFVTLLAYASVPLIGAKIAVDTMLFVVSYFVQRNWVFKTAGATQYARYERRIHASKQGANINAAL